MYPQIQDQYFQSCLDNIARQMEDYLWCSSADVPTQSRTRVTSLSVDSENCSTESHTPNSPLSDAEEDIEEVIRKELMANRQLPYRNYICHRCGQQGHMIRFCPTKNPDKEASPYQGNRRSVGVFNCPKCCRRWSSMNTFSNCAYRCKSCGQSVFPTKMYPLEKPSGKVASLLKP